MIQSGEGQSACDHITKSILTQKGTRHPLITSDFRLYRFYGAKFWWKEINGIVVSAVALKLGKQRNTVWRPTLNWYGAFTVPEFQQRGFASELYHVAEQEAVERGCRWMKSLAGSYAGARLHLSLGQGFWGRNGSDELVIGHPLPGHEDRYVGKIPTNATLPLPMTSEEVLEEAERGLRYDK